MPSRERPKPVAGGIKAADPGFIAPALATSITRVPSGERWIHEITNRSLI
jgi:bifunctional non-homologous end joining protein LigD